MLVSWVLYVILKDIYRWTEIGLFRIWSKTNYTNSNSLKQYQQQLNYELHKSGIY